MKKQKLIIFIIGIILVLIPILFPSILNKNSKHNISNINKDIKNNEWTILYGSELTVKKDEYNQENLFNEYFYSTDGTKSKYIFSVPKDNILLRTTDYLNYYAGEIIVKYGDNEIQDIDKFINQYIEYYQNNYDKLYLRKMIINENKIAIDFRSYRSSNDDSFEELNIIFKNADNNYSYVKYQIQNIFFSEEFMNKVINNFKLTDEIADYNICSQSKDKYLCTFDINSINKKIEFSVDSTKYSLKETISSNNYQVRFENIISEDENELDEQIYISFILSDSLINTLNDSENFKLSQAQNIKIGGKNIKKYDLTVNTAYLADYIIDLNNNLAVYIDIESTQNSMDEAMKYFTDFKLVDK